MSLVVGGEPPCGDEALVHLTKQTKSAGLDLSDDNLVTAAGLAAITELPLRFLDVTGLKTTTNEALENVGRIRSLERVRLELDPAATDFTSLANLTELRTLEIKGGLPAGLLSALAWLTKLETLKIQGCGFRDDDLRNLSKLTRSRRWSLRNRASSPASDSSTCRLRIWRC